MFNDRLVYFTVKKIAGDKKNFIPPTGWDKFSKEVCEHIRDPDDKVICVRTGALSGVTVWDFDTQSGYDLVCRKFPDIKRAPTVKTPKGYHSYLKYNQNHKTTQNHKSKIDIRNDGALAFGAGTVREDGSEYKLINDGEFDIDMPQSIYDALMALDNNTQDIQVAVPVPSVPIAEVTQAPPTQHPPNDEDWECRLVGLIGSEDWDYTETWMKIIWSIKHHAKTNSKFTIDFADKMSSQSERYKGNRAERVRDPKLVQLWNQPNTYGSFGYLVNLAKKHDSDAVHNLYKKHKYKTYDCDWDDMGMTQKEVAEYCLELYGDHIKTDKYQNLYILGGNHLWRAVDKSNTVDLKSLIQQRLLPHFRQTIKTMKGNDALKDVAKSYKEWYATMSKDSGAESLGKQLMTSLRYKAENEGIEIDPPNNSLHFKNGVLMLDRISATSSSAEHFRDRRPDDYATYCMPYDWREEGIKEEDVAYWTTTLNNIHNDEEDRMFLKDNLAYSLTGNPKKSQRVTLNVGYKASNGKSHLYANILKSVFCEYIQKTTPEMFNKNNDTKHKIIGKLLTQPTRIAWTDELGDKDLDIEFIKDTSSGMDATYNVLYQQNPNTRAIHFVLVWNSNTDLNLGKSADAGIMRRISKTTWSNQFLETDDKGQFKSTVTHKIIRDTDGTALTIDTDDVGLKHGLYPQDGDMEDKLKDDACRCAFIKALFPHFLRFYKATDKTGEMMLYIPDKIRRAQSEASAENDPREEFIIEFIVKSEGEMILKAELISKINDYAKDRRPYTDKEIMDSMKKHGYEYDRTKKHKGSRSCFMDVKVDETKLKQHLHYIALGELAAAAAEELEEEPEC